MTAKHSNNKFTVLLADRNKDNLRLMTEYLSQTEDFVVLDFAFDGRQALELTKELEPDLLIIDSILPKLDCFAVLEELAASGYKKDTKVIVTSEVRLDFVLKKAESFGIGHVFLKPLEKEAFLRRVSETVRQQAKGAAFMRVRVEQCSHEIVTRHIRTVGITANVKGYQYLRDAIILVQEDFSLINRLSTELYVFIASKYSSTPSCVERAIRHAIGAAWARGNARALESFLGFAIFEQEGRPSNGAVIAMLADKLNTELSYMVD